MPSKVTVLFETVTAFTSDARSQRTAGWSESHWTAENDPAVALALIGLEGGASVVANRLPLLPKQASVVGARAQSYNIDSGVAYPNSPAVVAKARRFAAVTTDTDQPGASLNVRATVGATNPVRISFALKNWPDSWIVGGESVRGEFETALQLYFNSLIGGRWGSVYGNRGANPAVPIVSVSATGLVTVIPGVSYVAPAPGQMMAVLRTVTEAKKKVGGKFRVRSAAGATIQLDGWDKIGLATKGGMIRKYALVFGAFQPLGFTIRRANSRKIGRPFDQYHGRTSKRRPT